tara:strand:- start:3517 stop:3747 length:231 start_codon:yes stop_codon:yes gene_type:complete
MKITITSKLDTASAARLRRRAAKNFNTYNSAHVTFYKCGRNQYECADPDADKQTAHATARRMMVIAGQTFDYELSA